MSSHNVLERGAGPSGYTKVSRPVHDYLGPNTNKLWLHTHTHNLKPEK